MSVGIFETDDGTKEIVKNEIKKIDENLSDKIRDELELIWVKILDEAINLCPKESGALATSITVLEGGATLGGTVSSGAGRNVKSVVAGPSISGNLIFDRTIVAGDETVVNFRNQPSSQYASLVHDGHFMRNGTYWVGVPFLTDALMKYENELQEAVNRALTELGITGSAD